LLTSSESFVAEIEKCLAAWRAGDFGAAEAFATNLYLYGELLAAHPDFQRSLAKRRASAPPPLDALRSMCDFLAAACDCRGRLNHPRALGRFGED
jgi:hypothetical protein